MLTFHILNMYVDKTQPRQFKFTFNDYPSYRIITFIEPYHWMNIGNANYHLSFDSFADSCSQEGTRTLYRTPETAIALFSLSIDVLRIRLLLESLHDSRPMLGAGSSFGVELFQVFMCTGLWQDGTALQVFRCLFIPTFTRCLSILVIFPISA